MLKYGIKPEFLDALIATAHRSMRAQNQRSRINWWRPQT